jgi:hypothetical protein
MLEDKIQKYNDDELIRKGDEMSCLIKQRKITRSIRRTNERILNGLKLYLIKWKIMFTNVKPGFNFRLFEVAKS